MKLAKCIFSGLIALLLAACGPTAADRERIARAETIVRQQPDSALFLLDSITNEGRQNRDLRARTAIVEAEACYQKSIRLNSDSLLDEAVEYYRSKPESPRRLRALYLRGYQNFLADRYGNALVDYLAAEQTAKALADSISLGLIYRGMGDIYFHIHDFNNSLVYFKKSKDIFNSVAQNVYSCESIIILGVAYFNAYKYDDCIEVLEPLLSLKDELPDEEIASVQCQILYAFVNKHDYANAKK